VLQTRVDNQSTTTTAQGESVAGGREPLFRPLTAGALSLPNRIVMAPLTRGRSDAGRVPNALMAGYYGARAGMGLLISEATGISREGAAWPGAPGIFLPEHVAGWRLTTDAVHAAGGRIVLQLWHMGRAGHPDAHPDGLHPVAPSAIAIPGDAHTPKGKRPQAVPRALEAAELPRIVADYVQAARLAKEAGFDGVEVHGANGYLLDEFLRDSANTRADAYGGPVENRARLLLEVADAVIGVWGADRVGVRLSPTNAYNGMSDADPVATFTYAARELGRRGIAYLHVIEAPEGHFLRGAGTPEVLPSIRAAFPGVVVVNGGFDGDSAARAIAEGRADAVAFGRPALANPDLARRLRIGAPLNAPDPTTFYSTGPKGYADYPVLGEAAGS